MNTTRKASTLAHVPVRIGRQETLVYLVRHAQTAWNIERRFQGQIDVPLSEEGLAQAEIVANWLTSQKSHFTALYTSDLLRANQTARPIADRLGLVAQDVAALREIHAGEWQGLLTDDIEELYPGQLARWHREADEFRLPGGETIPEVQARICGWYKQAIEAHRGQAIIVVSHGLAIRSLLAALEGWDVADTERMRKAIMGNTGVTAVLADHVTGQNSVLFHNSLAHLESTHSTRDAQERTNEPAAV
jgi:broad specificity phosphatase PhoE